MYITTFLYITIAMIPVMLGIAGSVLMPGISDPEFILPAFGIKYLPPLAMAVFVGALFSALMSSADGGILAPASIFSQNILKTFKKNVKEKQFLWATRWKYPRIQEEVWHPGFPFSQTRTLEWEKFFEGIK